MQGLFCALKIVPQRKCKGNQHKCVKYSNLHPAAAMQCKESSYKNKIATDERQQGTANSIVFKTPRQETPSKALQV